MLEQLEQRVERDARVDQGPIAGIGGGFVATRQCTEQWLVRE